MGAWTFLMGAALFGVAAIFPVPGWTQAEIFPSPGWTETLACDASSAGQLSVQANVQCACRFFAASQMRRTSAGYRWDCGILRARTNHEVPETANPYPYPLPPALSLDGAFILEDRDRPRFR
jgi:hypothetical protein